jgi:hypothetical protein
VIASAEAARVAAGNDAARATEALAWLVGLPGSLGAGADLKLLSHLLEEARGTVSLPAGEAPPVAVPTITDTTPGTSGSTVLFGTADHSVEYASELWSTWAA